MKLFLILITPSVQKNTYTNTYAHTYIIPGTLTDSWGRLANSELFADYPL